MPTTLMKILALLPLQIEISSPTSLRKSNSSKIMYFFQFYIVLCQRFLCPSSWGSGPEGYPMDILATSCSTEAEIQEGHRSFNSTPTPHCPTLVRLTLCCSGICPSLRFALRLKQVSVLLFCWNFDHST